LYPGSSYSRERLQVKPIGAPPVNVDSSGVIGVAVLRLPSEVMQPLREETGATLAAVTAPPEGKCPTA
jgi:hypothetical protein